MRAFAIALLFTTGCEAATALGIFETNGAVTSSTNVVLTTETGEDISATRVRVVLATRDQPLRVDTRAARLVTSIGAVPPLAANAATPVPLVALEPRTTATVDLYFAGGDDAPTFNWTIAGTALRARIEVDDAAPKLAGMNWWFSPNHIWATFRHQDGVITRRPPRFATVRAASDDADCEPPCDQW